MAPVQGFGSLGVVDRVSAQFVNVLEFGEQNLFDYLDDLLTTHNALTKDQLSYLCQFTTERTLGYGGTPGAIVQETDEWGRADASKGIPGTNIDLPLRLFQSALQWTKKYFQGHSPDELEAQFKGHLLADTQNIQEMVKSALFGSTNYTYIDHLVDYRSLAVKRLANADSTALPPGPNGESFDGTTHTHYVADASYNAADVQALLLNVAEHYKMGKLNLLINAAQEAGIRGHTGAGEFTPINPVEIITQTDDNIGRGNLDTNNLYDRQIGFYGTMAARVWVKPWIPSGYLLAIMTGLPKKVLSIRTRPGVPFALQLDYEQESYPLRARGLGREFGVGVTDRLGAAVLYTGGGSYVDPTF